MCVLHNNIMSELGTLIGISSCLFFAMLLFLNNIYIFYVFYNNLNTLTYPDNSPICDNALSQLSFNQLSKFMCIGCIFYPLSFAYHTHNLFHQISVSYLIFEICCIHVVYFNMFKICDDNTINYNNHNVRQLYSNLSYVGSQFVLFVFISACDLFVILKS